MGGVGQNPLRKLIMWLRKSIPKKTGFKKSGTLFPLRETLGSRTIASKVIKALIPITENVSKIKSHMCR